MYRMAFIIGKISPDRANRTPTRSRGVLLPTEGGSFRIMTGDVLYIIPIITRLRAKSKKLLHMVSFYNLFVTASIPSVDQQRK